MQLLKFRSEENHMPLPTKAGHFECLGNARQRTSFGSGSLANDDRRLVLFARARTGA